MNTTTGSEISPNTKVDTNTKESTSPTSPAPEPIIYSLSSVASSNHCIIVSGLIVASHALFLWGQLDDLWGQFVYSKVNVTADVDAGGESGMGISNGAEEETVLLGSWSYGAMLNELWIYSKVTAVFLFIFSAFWPHFKLVLLHIYFYRPVPARPRQAAMYWLDSFGKMSLADVCATCMIFLLLNIQATIDLGQLVEGSQQLMGNVIPFIYNTSVLPDNGDSLLSNKTQSILDNLISFEQAAVGELTEIIFESDRDTDLYGSLLEKGCSQFYNGGDTCGGTPFYEPADIKGGIAHVMTKCLRIRNDKCSQCECVVNNAIYNHDIPGSITDEIVSSGTTSIVFAKVLAMAKTDSFASLFDVEGTASVGMYVTIYPAFLGFTIAVFISIAASLLVCHIEEKDAMKKHYNASSLDEVLNNSDIDTGSRSKLFVTDGNTGLIKRLLATIFGLGIIPLIFSSIYVEMFDLSIAGLFEELLLMQPVATNTYYSIIETVTAVNDGSGYGKTFAVFYGVMLLAFPMLRATLLALVTLIPMSPIWHIRLAQLSNNIGSYIGWEPFFLCVMILGSELPSLTEGTVPPETCQELEQRNFVSFLVSRFGLDTDTCFVMYFNLMPTFALFAFAWAILTTFNSLAWKEVLTRYDPFGTLKHLGDMGGPYYNCRQCCYCGLSCKRKREID